MGNRHCPSFVLWDFNFFTLIKWILQSPILKIPALPGRYLTICHTRIWLTRWIIFGIRIYNPLRAMNEWQGFFPSCIYFVPCDVGTPDLWKNHSGNTNSLWVERVGVIRRYHCTTESDKKKFPDCLVNTYQKCISWSRIIIFQALSLSNRITQKWKVSDIFSTMPGRSVSWWIYNPIVKLRTLAYTEIFITHTLSRAHHFILVNIFYTLFFIGLFVFVGNNTGIPCPVTFHG